MFLNYSQIIDNLGEDKIHNLYECNHNCSGWTNEWYGFSIDHNCDGIDYI